MSAKKKVPASKCGSVGTTRAIRFQNLTQLEVIKKAAERCGWSVNAFVIRSAYAAAQRELEMPPREIYGLNVESLESPAA